MRCPSAIIRRSRRSDRQLTPGRIISTGAQLAGLAALVREGNELNGRTINLTRDVNLCGLEWRRIGNDSSPFRGSFNGGGAIYNQSAVTLENVLIASCWAYGGNVTSNWGGAQS